jgi:hypothetical protein
MPIHNELRNREDRALRNPADCYDTRCRNTADVDE